VRSLELGSELLLVMTAVPRLRSGLRARLERFRDQAHGHPDFEAVARIHSAQEQLWQGGSAETAAADVQAALAAGLPSSANAAALLSLLTLALAEQYDLVQRMLDVALERARLEGHATRLGIIHGQRAAIALAQGALPDAQVEAETGLLLVDDRHLAVHQLLAVAIDVHIERGELEEGVELAARGEALGIAEEAAYVGEFLTARGRLRIACGQVREGVADLLWCGERREARGLQWPSDWKAFAAPALATLGDAEAAANLARDQLAIARRVGAPGALGFSLRSAALALGGEGRLPLLEEAVSVLEHSTARLEPAHGLADLGSELGRVARRPEGRDAQREALKLAGQCGALALAERARADLHAGPGRRARTELTGPGALTGAEWRVCRQAAEDRTNREIA